MRTMVAVMAALCSSLSLRAGAQIQGSVRDALTSEPVRGAVVVTLGPRRELLGRIITSSSGTFRIGQDSAVIVRVMRIGYSPQERRLEGTAAPIVIELTPLGRGLRAVTVSSNPLWSADWSSSSDAGW